MACIKTLLIMLTILLLAYGFLPSNAPAQTATAEFGFSSWTYPDFGFETDRPSSDPHAKEGVRCSVCHGSVAMTESFQPAVGNASEDACIFCHVDDGRYTDRPAYSGGEGAYPANGHTTGAGPDIPSSSVRQWLEPVALESGMEEDGGRPALRVRRYDSRQQKLFIYTAVDTTDTEDRAERGLVRYGPLNLTCISCHQPHNSPDLVWKPPGAPGGYKLLRASPSGSFLTSDTAYDPLIYTGRMDPARFAKEAVVTVPEDDFGPGNTGHNLGKEGLRADSQTALRVFTTWTQWKGTTETLTASALSVWCADCHNLQIGANDLPNGASEPLSGSEGFHGDRTHTAGTKLTPCYACHRGSGDGGRISENTPGWEPTATAENPGGTDCARCHYDAGRYEIDNPANDFPHSGAIRSAKLLPDWYDASAGEALDQICKYCHDGIGTEI